MGGRLEAFLGKTLFDFIFSPAVFFKLVFLGRLVVFTTLEFLRPARAFSYLSVIGKDLLAYGSFRYIVLPICIYLNDIVPGYHPAPASIAHLPLAIRVLLYFILADFGHYWIHRLTHTRHFWRVHKWHHSTREMYWLGGARTTVPDFFMVNISVCSGLLGVLHFTLVDGECHRSHQHPAKRLDAHECHLEIEVAGMDFCHAALSPHPPQ
jgi:lathosterol oxidase